MKTRYIVLVALVALLLVAAAPAQTPTAPTIPEAVLLLIPFAVGWIAVPLITFLKNQFSWTDPRANVWLSFIVSAALSVLLLLITGSFVPINGDPLVILGWVSLTFTTATMVYKSVNTQPTPPAAGGAG